MIKNLVIQNFRIHENTELPMNRLNLFVGGNGAGKTSIIAAIQLLLTGRCVWTDKRGTGAADLIMHGADQAEISADVEGIGRATRTIPGGLSVEGWSGSSTVQQQALYEKMGMDDRVIDALVNSTHFVSLPPADQKDLLFELMGANYSRDDIKTMLEEWAAEKKEAPDPLVELLESYRGKIEGGPEVFDELDKYFREERRQAKKNLDLAKAKTELLKKPSEKTEIKTAKEYDQARAELEAAQSAGEYDRLQTELKAAAAELGALQKVDQKEIDRLTEDLEMKQHVLTMQEKSQDNLRYQASELKGMIKGVRETTEQIKSAVMCPLAPEIIECPLSKDNRDQVVENLNRQAERHETELAEIEQILADEDTGGAEAIKAQAAELEQKRWTNKEYEKAESKLKAIEQALDELPEENNNTDATALLEEIRAYEAIEKYKAEVAAAKEEKAAAEKKVKTLEVMVEACGPAGLKEAAVQKTIGGIADQADQLARALTGYGLRFDLENFTIYATTEAGDIRLDRLSRSEKTRIGIALQHILNTLIGPGAGLLVVDDAEQLDPENKKKMLNLLIKIKKGYSAILVMAAKGDKAPVNPGIEGLSVYTIENGAIKEVGPGAKA
jgi:DNA repair exonuclease SbcCD ATPase subunit